MPENLPTPKKSFKQLKKGNNKSLKKSSKWSEKTCILHKAVV